jgi:dipeptidyl aminopeptidase/acylaminoacyl peptidase
LLELLAEINTRGEHMKSIRFALSIVLVCLLAPVAATPQSSPLTVDDIINMEAAGEFQLSPDGLWVVWVKTVNNGSKNKYNSHIYLSSASTENTIQLTRGNNSDRSPRFSPDGSHVAFLGARGEKAKTQIYILSLRGGEPTKVTKTGSGVRAFEWLDDDTFLYTAREDSTLRERKLKSDKDDVVVVSDQEHYTPVRLFRHEIKSGTTRRLTTNTGVITSFALSPDGKKVVTSENQSVDYRYDYRIPPKQFLLDLDSDGRTEIFTSPHTDPYDFKWAPDSEGFYCRQTVASDSTDTFVGISRLFYYNLEDTRLIRVAADWENGLGRAYYVVKDGLVAALAAGTIDRIAHLTRKNAGDEHDLSFLETEKPVRLAAADPNGNRIVYFTSDASSVPVVKTATVARDQIENRRELIELNESLKKKSLSESDVIRWAGARGDSVEGVLYYPAGYDTAFSFPLVVVIHGGPTGVDPDFFTERWSNYPHLLASRETFVLKVNYHGSGNYGLSWMESIRGHYYELEVPDILTGIDFMIERGDVDENAIGIMGWSNGSILAIACCLESDRFKVMCAGAGDVNWTSDYGNCAFGAAFDNAYFGGPPWEIPQVYVDKSPLFRIQNIKTPTLIMFGGKDTSVPTEQGWQHFRAMQQIGVAPVRFLLFPGTGHGLVKPSHRKRKMNEELAWFDKYLFDSFEKKNEAFDDSSPLAYALRKLKIKKVGYLVGEEVDASICPETVEADGIQASRFEITRAQFSAFDPNYDYPAGTDNYPVTEVSIPMAQAYCMWLTEKTGRKHRLPTVEEMDKLLALAKSNLNNENNLNYWLGFKPTPDEMEIIREKIDELEAIRLLIEPVGSFRPVVWNKDVEIYDLGGNVAEWVTDKSGQGRIRGLSAVSGHDQLEEYSRPPLNYIGFRVVVEE